MQSRSVRRPSTAARKSPPYCSIIGQQQVAAGVTTEAARIVECRQTGQEQAASLGLVSGQGERALQHVARREHAELVAELTRAAAAVEHRDDGIHPQPRILLQAPKQAGQPGSAAEAPDVDFPQPHGAHYATRPACPRPLHAAERPPPGPARPAGHDLPCTKPPLASISPYVPFANHRAMQPTVRSVALSLGALAFCLLALLNVGGYRYGVSDQAFYIPIVRQGLEPGLFPHDAPLLAVQNRLLAFDDWFAPLVS